MKYQPQARAISQFLLHLHPSKVDQQSIKFTRTFGLGGMAALLFVLLFISGMLLRFAYVPSVVGAYDSIVDLQNNVVFGQLLRNTHYWSGMLLVVVAFLHVLRVVYSQSIYFERRKNWLYGLMLMFVVMFSNFTGYLLPWDQLSFWAVTIMTNMLSYIPLVGPELADLVRGGAEVSETTLLRFYHFHTGLLPLLMVFFMSIHFWLVRKAKGVTVRDPKAKIMVKTYPELVYKELVVALGLILAIFVFSMLFNAPLLDKANPLISPNPSRAPWYFMGFQELLLHIHPTFGVFVIPFCVTGFLIYIPFIKSPDINVGVWFNSSKGKKVTLVSIAFSVLLTVFVIVSSEYFLDLKNWMPRVPLWITTGLLLLLLYFVPVLAFIMFLKTKYKVTVIDVVLSLFTIVITAYVVMAIIGSFFRGEGMSLLI